MNRLVRHGLTALITLAGIRTAAAEEQYLAFQIFEGGPDPAIPFDSSLIYTPKDKISAIAHDIVTTIGVTGGGLAKLAVILGPISFDHTDAEARQIIDDGFAIALAENVAVGFHLDDAMFWSNRTELMGDPANVEWTDFAGTVSTGLKLDWAHPPARMCFNAPKIQAEVTRRARDVIGAEIVSQLAILKVQGKERLFAGVIAGWESHMGQDVVTNDRVGFHALTNRGYGPGHPPADVSAEVASIVAEFIGLWTGGLAQAGLDPTRIYTHVNFLTRAQFATLPVPPNVTYEMLVDLAPSSQQPSVAFAANSRPGFSTYPGPGLFDQIQEERLLHGEPGWASSEGTNLLPPSGDSNMTMETYLARCFNHGATLVDLYSWGIGGPSMRDTNPFRIVTQGPAALAAYRKFLAGQTLVETAVNNPPRATAQSVTTPEDTAQAITLVATDADLDPLAYVIVAHPTHGTLSGTGASRTYTPTANYIGADGFTFKANDSAADSNTATVSVTVSAASYASWTSRYFTTAQLADPTISGPTANPSGDGQPNLLKYTFGLDPNAPDFAHAPTVSTQTFSGSDYLQFSYRKRDFATDLTCTVQVSNDLITWNSGTSYTAFVSQSDNSDGTHQVIVRDLTATSYRPLLFMRLLVTQR